MTAADVIAALQRLPGHLPVRVHVVARDYEDDVDRSVNAEAKDIRYEGGFVAIEADLYID
jgi:hypothetical protein